MARRYGSKVKTERTWKKIARMNIKELDVFKKHLEKYHQFTSDVYKAVLQRIEVKGSII